MFGEACNYLTNHLAIIVKDGVDLILELLVAVPQRPLRVLMSVRKYI